MLFKSLSNAAAPLTRLEFISQLVRPISSSPNNTLIQRLPCNHMLHVDRPTCMDVTHMKVSGKLQAEHVIYPE